MVVDLFEIRAPGLPNDLESALANALAEQGAMLSWFMFEGAFGDIGELFATRWDAEQTYGIALETTEPEVRLCEADRTDPDWLRSIQCAAAKLYSAWPELRSSRSIDG